MLIHLGRLYERKGVSLTTLPIVGNALIATLEAALGNESCIETFNFFALFYNEGSNMLAEGYKDYKNQRHKKVKPVIRTSTN